MIEKQLHPQKSIPKRAKLYFNVQRVCFLWRSSPTKPHKCHKHGVFGNKTTKYEGQLHAAVSFFDMSRQMNVSWQG